MNSLAKFSLWMVLVTLFTLFCFAPGAFAQGRTNPLLPSHVRTVTSYTFTSTFLFDPIDREQNNKNKCDPHGRNKCAAVPEGGSALMYLLLASFTCLGAMVLRSRRRQSAR
jgi:hypothetical protein